MKTHLQYSELLRVYLALDLKNVVSFRPFLQMGVAKHASVGELGLLVNYEEKFLVSAAFQVIFVNFLWS